MVACLELCDETCSTELDDDYALGPYGTVLSSTNPGSVTNPFMFQGQYLDSESGLYYLRARYYDPTTAQFLSVDPMVANTRSPYAYVAENPLNTSDPDGQMAPNIPPPPQGYDYGPITPFRVWKGTNSAANSMAQRAGYDNAEIMKSDTVGEGEGGNTGDLNIYVDGEGNVFVGPANLPKNLPDEFRNYVEDPQGNIFNISAPASPVPAEPNNNNPDPCDAAYVAGFPWCSVEPDPGTGDGGGDGGEPGGEPGDIFPGDIFVEGALLAGGGGCW